MPLPDCHKRLWFLEGWPQKSNVLGARSLLESSGTNIPIRLCNPTDKPITLYRTLKVGMMEEVEENQVGEPSRSSTVLLYSHSPHRVTVKQDSTVHWPLQAIQPLTTFSEFCFKTPYKQPEGSPYFTPGEVL